jgi:WS/DGAT/MGAT family acyltransferase
VPTIDRLSALDAAFLDLDSATAPLHVGWTIGAEGRAPSLSALRRHVDCRLEHVPRFRRRVVRPRLGLGDAHWADDRSFDIANHVHAVRLPAPGGPGELRALAGALLSRPLDPRHPLWGLYLVTGMRGGWAVVGQAHHALIDGIAAVEVAMLLFDAAGHPPAPSSPSRWQPQRPPSAPAAAASFARSRLTGAAKAARTAAATVSHGGDVPAAVRQLATPAPATTLNRSATARRAVGFAVVGLEPTRAAGHRHGATINDMLLAAATLSLGRALRRRGERPAVAKVLVPVNVRDGGDAGMGNRISFVTVALPVALGDPIAVLHNIRAQTRARKSGGAAGPLQMVSEVADLLPGAARRIVARAAAHSASFNAVVSNVPGPPIELDILGRRVASMFPAVPFLHGHALSIGALSYRGRLHCGVYADAEVVPDAAEVARDLEAAFDALRVLPRRADTPWRARARSRRQRAANR